MNFIQCLIFTNYSAPEKIIIDTDAGVDDAIAILLLLSAISDKQLAYEVIGITCSYGNTEEAIVEQNVLKILTVANRSDVNIYHQYSYFYRWILIKK